MARDWMFYEGSWMPRDIAYGFECGHEAAERQRMPRRSEEPAEMLSLFSAATYREGSKNSVELYRQAMRNAG